MVSRYSIYEAKARLSEIIRAVKQRRRVTITERGIPVAQVVPLTQEETLADRVAELRAAGAIEQAARGPEAIETLARRPGALGRFLAERE